MALPVPDRTSTLESLEDSATRWAGLLRSARDPNRNAIGHWSVGDVAAHTTHLSRIFVEMARGGSSPVKDPLQMSEQWEKELQEDKERNLLKLADRIEQSASDLHDAATEDVWTTPVTWHGGIEIPFYSLPCLFMNESELHGLDVARAESKPWVIEAEKAALVIKGLFPVLPHFVNHEVAGDRTITWELRVRDNKPVYLHLEAGELLVDERRPDRIDCRVSVAPSDYLLVGYDRKSQWGPLLTGKILAWGRKPWLGLTLSKLFYTP